MAESIVTAAPIPLATRWSFQTAAEFTSRATTSPTKRAELEFEPDTKAVNPCRMLLAHAAGGCTRSS